MSDKNSGNLLSSVMPDPYDVRTRKRNITRGVITREDIQSHQKQLADEAEKVEVVGYDDLLTDDVPMDEPVILQSEQSADQDNIPNVVPVLDLPPGLLSTGSQQQYTAPQAPSPPAPKESTIYPEETYQHESILPSSSEETSVEANDDFGDENSDQ